MDSNRQFREWLKQQLEEYQITPGQLSVLVDGLLSEKSVRKLLDGPISWTSIPKDVKEELIPQLEAALGPLPREAQPQTRFRPTDLAPPPITVTDEKINEWLGLPEPEDGDNSGENEPPSSVDATQAELVLIDTPREEETIPSGSHSAHNVPESKSCWFASCSRCTEPITDDTKPCPGCGKRSDWSQ